MPVSSPIVKPIGAFLSEYLMSAFCSLSASVAFTVSISILALPVSSKKNVWKGFVYLQLSVMYWQRRGVNINKTYLARMSGKQIVGKLDSCR